METITPSISLEAVFRTIYRYYVANLLILEDNEDCISIYEDILTNHHLTIVRSLKELQDFHQHSKTKIDLMMADMKLPDGIFIEWVQTGSFSMEQLTTIIVSSMEDMEILTHCFEWGAVDYVIKPFKKNELVVKIAKALGQFSVRKDLEIEEEIKAILEELTSIEAKIFQQLVNHPDQFVNRDLIQPVVWKKVAVNPKTLDVHLSNIRKKLNSTNWVIDFVDHKGWKLTRKS